MRALDVAGPLLLRLRLFRRSAGERERREGEWGATAAVAE